MHSPQAMFQIFSLVSTLIGVGCQVVLIVVIAGAVRRHRPDAYQGLLGWAVASLAMTILTPVLYTSTSFAAARFGSGIDSVVFAQGVASLLMAVVHVGLVLFLARGLVKLAQPQAAPDISSGAAYR